MPRTPHYIPHHCAWRRYPKPQFAAGELHAAAGRCPLSARSRGTSERIFRVYPHKRSATLQNLWSAGHSLYRDDDHLGGAGVDLVPPEFGSVGTAQTGIGDIEQAVVIGFGCMARAVLLSSSGTSQPFVNLQGRKFNHDELPSRRPFRILDGHRRHLVAALFVGVRRRGKGANARQTLVRSAHPAP